MAVTYDKSIEDKTGGVNWCAVNSPLIIKWTDDTDPGSVEYGQLTINTNFGEDVYTRLVPDNLGVCRYDLREVLISALESIPGLLPSYSSDIEEAEDLYTYVTVTPAVFVGATLVTGDPLGLYVCRALMQNNPAYVFDGIQENPFTELFQFKDGALAMRILSPGVEDRSNYNDEQKITLFTGYPQTISMIATLQPGGGYEYKVNGTSVGQVNHLAHILLSTGAAQRPYVTGGSLEIGSDDISGVCTVAYKEVDKCGVYLRWLNDQGGYSYFLFGRVYKESEEIKGMEYIGQTVDDLAGTTLAQAIGFDGQVSTELMASELEQYEVNILRSLPKSTHVWLYVGDNGDVPSSYKWQRIFIANGRWIITDTKKKLYKMAVTMISQPLNYQRY